MTMKNSGFTTLPYLLRYRGICPICDATLIKFDKEQLLCLNCYNYFNIRNRQLKGYFRFCDGCGKLMYRYSCDFKQRDARRPPRGRRCLACANRIKGRLGGTKGGPARALKLSKERRTEIAQRAAKIRWSRYRKAKSLEGEQNVNHPENSQALSYLRNQIP
jgi:hypothetical protein